MNYVKYMLISTFSTALGLVAICSAFGNPLAGLGLFFLMPYMWGPAVLINAGLLCYFEEKQQRVKDK